jgi:hypothetical protein
MSESYSGSTVPSITGWLGKSSEWRRAPLLNASLERLRERASARRARRCSANGGCQSGPPRSERRAIFWAFRLGSHLGGRYDEIDRCCLCISPGNLGTGHAACAAAARRYCYAGPGGLRSGNAPREWCLHENSRPPCRQQVRPRSDLLGHGTKWTVGLMTETFEPASKRWPYVAYWHNSDEPITAGYVRSWG